VGSEGVTIAFRRLVSIAVTGAVVTLVAGVLSGIMLGGRRRLMSAQIRPISFVPNSFNVNVRSCKRSGIERRSNFFRRHRLAGDRAGCT
jgi:hypothetical protein